MKWKECTCLLRSGLSLAIKIAPSVLLKIHELANAKFFHWKMWPGWDAEWQAGSENFLVSLCSACLIEKFLVFWCSACLTEKFQADLPMYFKHFQRFFKSFQRSLRVIFRFF